MKKSQLFHRYMLRDVRAFLSGALTLSFVFWFYFCFWSPSLPTTSPPQITTPSSRTLSLQTLDRHHTWTKRIEDWTPFHEYVFRTKDCTECPQLHKWESYFSAYHKHFSRYRNRPVTMMEVGVQSGGSALMWRWYFGAQFRYVGIDVNPATKQFDNGDWCRYRCTHYIPTGYNNTPYTPTLGTVIIGDQSDPSFWRSIHDQYKVDIFLDDGGHTMEMQRVTFFSVFHTLIDVNGLYVCEDLATSYVSQFGGLPGVIAPESVSFTMVGLTQQFLDWINGYFVDGLMPSMEPVNINGNNIASDFARSVKGIYVYSQLVVVEKSDEDKLPGTVLSGGRSIPYVSSQATWNGETFDLDYYLSVVQDLLL